MNLSEFIHNRLSTQLIEGYDDVSLEYTKSNGKLREYTEFKHKKIVNNVTYLDFPDILHKKIINPDSYTAGSSDKWVTWGIIKAFDNTDGTEIGNASYGQHTEWDDLKASVDVRPDKRRMGIASEMYKWIEELTGDTLQPDVPHSKSAQALWANPNRKFGERQV